MQIVIDIDKDQYEMVKQYRGSYDFGYAIAEGTVLPEGSQIITKEVYDYLCTKVEGTEDMEEIKHNRPKSGEWIRDGSMIECSLCECRMPKELKGVTGAILDLQTEYCPNCGARMKEAEDEE